LSTDVTPRGTAGEAAPGLRHQFRRNLVALEGAQKTPKGASLYSRYINRPFGRRLAAAAHVAQLTPNQVTLLSALFSFTGIFVILAFQPTPVGGVAIAAALLLGYALDSADGQLARLRTSGGRAGEWLDHVLDCAVKLALHGAVLVAWYRSDLEARYLLLAFAFQFVAVLLFFGGTLAEKLRENSTGTTHGPFHGTRLIHVSEVLRLFVDHATICLAFLTWGWPDVFLICYALLFVAHSAFLVAFGTHLFQELS